MDSLKLKIIAKKNEINKIYETKLLPAKLELEILMNEAATNICPFNIGDTVIFENEKKGLIEKISYFSLNYIDLLGNIPPVTKINYEVANTFDYSQSFMIEYYQNEFSFTWQIEGVMIKNDGKPGKRKFLPKNPYSNIINGNRVSERTVANTLGLSEFFEIH